MQVHSDYTGMMAGTIGGTLLSIFSNIQSEDIIKTSVLAGIGAIVSFFVSLGLKWIIRRRSR